MNSELAKVAAKWWADHLRTRPVMKSNSAHDILLNAVAANKPALDEMSISLFELALCEVLDVCIQHNRRLVIDVDYDACDELEEAAKVAGIDINRRLPIKTDMVIENGYIEVAQGYGSLFELLYKEGE